MNILNPSTIIAIIEGAQYTLEKSIVEWTSEDKEKKIFDNMVKYILYKKLDKNTFIKIKMCFIAKKIWKNMIQLYKGNHQTKENKLYISMQSLTISNEA